MNLNINFDSPWYLLLLVLVPLLWVFSFKSLSGLGRVRRLVALALRTIVLLIVILSLAELQLLRTSQKLTVIYLLDQSESIPTAQRQAMLVYVIQEVSRHRDADREDRAGLIVFGREAAIEVPPFNDELPLVGKLESVLDMRTDATNLAAAMKLAQASFPEDSARRIVIVSDGNENLGDARAVAQRLTADGVGIDVVPVLLGARSEVAVEKVTLPDEVRKGQPLEARIVLNNMTQPTSENPGHVKGTLKLIRRSGDHEETLDESPVDLPPGKKVFSFNHEIDQPDFYTYEARFEPDDPRDDLMRQNNRATAFTHVRGRGHVLLVEDWEHPGEFKELIDRLRSMNIEVTRRGSNQPFSSLAELQRYDSVILANVPRSSAGDSDTGDALVTNFTDSQIQMLVRNTQQMGSGLIMIGGDRSFGAGGWANTELEKAMPVDFTIKNKKVRGVGALVLLMHASEMAQGNHWQKVVAREAVKALGPMDYCGLIHWNDMRGRDDWLWRDSRKNGLVRVGQNRQQMLKRLGRMAPGDMPQFDPSMKMALSAFNKATDASVKHMIIISDGDPSPPSGRTLRAFASASPKPKGIQISTVAIGTHGPAGSNVLRKIATRTGGKYYRVTNAKALPKIYQREVHRIARPLVYEKPVIPRVKFRHEMLRGIDEDALPAINGFVLTTLKENPLVEVSLVSPRPVGEKNATVLASWTYGLGRTVALTTDAGARWAQRWTGWDKYDRLFSQIVRWSMRPAQEHGKYSVATEVKDGKVQVVVTALDKDDEYLNFLDFTAAGIGPDMKSFPITVHQTAPGRYVGQFDAGAAGSYFLVLSPGAGQAPVRTGISVPYSSEFRQHDTNQALLSTLAELKPKGGKPGRVIQGFGRQNQVEDLLKTNTFLHQLLKAQSSQDVWPLLILLASSIFFADVFFRRVTVGFEWLGPLWVHVRDTVLRRELDVAPDERLERLRSRKAQVSAAMDERRAAARFEPQVDTDVDVETLGEQMPGQAAQQRPTEKQSSPDAAPEEETYTERLLKAKQRVWKDKKDL